MASFQSGACGLEESLPMCSGAVGRVGMEMTLQPTGAITGGEGGSAVWFGR